MVSRTVTSSLNFMVVVSGDRRNIKYNYHYAYMPRAKVTQDGVCYILEVEGMSDSVEVRKV